MRTVRNLFVLMLFFLASCTISYRGLQQSQQDSKAANLSVQVATSRHPKASEVTPAKYNSPSVASNKSTSEKDLIDLPPIKAGIPETNIGITGKSFNRSTAPKETLQINPKPEISTELKNAKKELMWAYILLAGIALITFYFFFVHTSIDFDDLQRLACVSLIIPFSLILMNLMHKKERYKAIKQGNKSFDHKEPSAQDIKKGKKKAVWSLVHAIAAGIIMTVNFLNQEGYISFYEGAAFFSVFALVSIFMAFRALKLLENSDKKLFKVLAKMAISITTFSIYFYLINFINILIYESGLYFKIDNVW